MALQSNQRHHLSTLAYTGSRGKCRICGWVKRDSPSLAIAARCEGSAVACFALCVSAIGEPVEILRDEIVKSLHFGIRSRIKTYLFLRRFWKNISLCLPALTPDIFRNLCDAAE